VVVNEGAGGLEVSNGVFMRIDDQIVVVEIMMLIGCFIMDDER